MKILMILCCVFILFLQFRLWFGQGSLMRAFLLKKEVITQIEKVHHLKDRNAQLTAEVSDLKNQLDAVEERARFDLGMIRMGEVFYQEQVNG